MVKRRQKQRRRGMQGEIQQSEGPFWKFAKGIGFPKTSEAEWEARSRRFRESINEWRRAKTIGEKRAYWDRLSKEWHELMPPKVSEREIELISKIGEIRPTDRIVSIGSGTGLKEAFIAKHLVPQGRVICVDFSHKMSERAKQIKARAEVRNLSIITADEMKIPLRSNSQDKVIAMQNISLQSKEWRSLLQEAKRVLKKTPQARLIVTTGVSDLFEIQIMIEKLRMQGFEPLEAITFMQMENKTAVFLIAKPALLI